MTKFILHGGFEPGKKQENDAFFKEVLKDAPKKSKILLVYFAKEEDRVATNMAEDIEQFKKNGDSMTLSFERATELYFREQVSNSDIIYLHGGHSGKLYEALSNYSNLDQLFRNKTVAGDSAGANVLCLCFYSMKIGAHQGFGLLPVKVITHFVAENRNKLDGWYPEVETLLLPEYQYTTLMV